MIAYDDFHAPCLSIRYLWVVFDCFVAMWRNMPVCRRFLTFVSGSETVV